MTFRLRLPISERAAQAATETLLRLTPDERKYSRLCREAAQRAAMERREQVLLQAAEALLDQALHCIDKAEAAERVGDLERAEAWARRARDFEMLAGSVGGDA